MQRTSKLLSSLCLCSVFHWSELLCVHVVALHVEAKRLLPLSLFPYTKKIYGKLHHSQHHSTSTILVALEWPVIATYGAMANARNASKLVAHWYPSSANLDKWHQPAKLANAVEPELWLTMVHLYAKQWEGGCEARSCEAVGCKCAGRVERILLLNWLVHSSLKDRSHSDYYFTYTFDKKRENAREAPHRSSLISQDPTTRLVQRLRSSMQGHCLAASLKPYKPIAELYALTLVQKC
jgi:hypothetical protein